MAEEILEEMTTEEQTEQITVVGDIISNLTIASANLAGGKAGSDERLQEDKIYENHVQKLIDYEHLELEKQKYALEDRKAYLTLQLEDRKVQLEERKAELLSQQEIKHTKNDNSFFGIDFNLNCI